jgi:hypothetical protein
MHRIFLTIRGVGTAKAQRVRKDGGGDGRALRAASGNSGGHQ